MLPLSLGISRRALQLCERYNIVRQRYFDMQLVATMLEEGIGTILTENSKDFEEIEDITVVNPFLDKCQPTRNPSPSALKARPNTPGIRLRA
mgnify:CR=1 FL=1